MSRRALSPAAALAAVVLASGCAAVRPQAAFEEVRAEIAARTSDGRAPVRVAWITGADEDAAARAAVDALRADSLTADAAVQIALLNNRHLQATFEDLGIAQAQLVQAGLLANPVFGARALWPLDGGGAPDLGFSVAFHFLDVLFVPLRRQIAQSDYEAARLRVTAAVVDLAVETRRAYVQAQADAARRTMQQTVVANAEAGYTAARLLREAGNVPATAVLAEQARYEQARLDALVAEGQAAASREALVRAMGLSGAEAALRLAGTLPPVPATPAAPFVVVDGEPTLDVAALERTAVEASLDLAAARADLEAAGRRLGLATPQSLVPELGLGAEVERSDGAWEAGPEVEIALPLFDAGQARRAAARAEVRRRQARYVATAVDVRSAARALATRLVTARQAALHYQTAVLPLRAALVRETLLQYNAMQVGVFEVLQAQALEADAAQRSIDAIAAYWTALAEADGLRMGRRPDLSGLDAAPTGGAAPRTAAPGH